MSVQKDMVKVGFSISVSFPHRNKRPPFRGREGMGLYACINIYEYIRTEMIAWCNLTSLATQKSFMRVERIEP